MKKSPAWPHILSGIIAMLAAGVLFTWSYFRAPLQALYPTWTASKLSFVFTAHNMAVGLTTLFVGPFIKKLHPRIPLACGGVLIGLGLMLMSFLPEDPKVAYTMAVICYGIVSPIGVGIMGLTTTNACPAWSPKHMGLIAGGVTFAFGCSSFYCGAIASRLIPKLGILMSFRCIAIIAWIMFAIAFPLIRMPKPEDNIPPAPPRAENLDATDYSTAQAVSSALFWALFAFNTFMRGSGLMFADNAVPIATAFGAAALLGMLYSPANGSAAIICGFLVDRLGYTRTMRLYIYIQLFGCACLFVGGLTATTALILIGLICGGFSYGGTTSVMVTGTKILFGNKNFTSTYGVLGIATFVAALLGNLGGIVVDKMNGNYYGVFSLCAFYGLCAFCAAMLVSVFVKKRAKKKAALKAENEAQA